MIMHTDEQRLRSIIAAREAMEELVAEHGDAALVDVYKLDAAAGELDDEAGELADRGFDANAAVLFDAAWLVRLWAADSSAAVRLVSLWLAAIMDDAAQELLEARQNMDETWYDNAFVATASPEE